MEFGERIKALGGDLQLGIEPDKNWREKLKSIPGLTLKGTLLAIETPLTMEQEAIATRTTPKFQAGLKKIGAPERVARYGGTIMGQAALPASLIPFVGKGGVLARIAKSALAGGALGALQEGPYVRAFEDREPTMLDRLAGAGFGAAGAGALEGVGAGIGAVRRGLRGAGREAVQEAAEGVTRSAVPDLAEQLDVEGRMPEPEAPAPRGAELPAQQRLPDTGTYAAIKTNDGSIYFDPVPTDRGGSGVHAQILDQQGVPLAEVRSSGFLRDGEYYDAGASDVMAQQAERARARIRADARRSGEPPRPIGPEPQRPPEATAPAAPRAAPESEVPEPGATWVEDDVISVPDRPMPEPAAGGAPLTQEELELQRLGIPPISGGNSPQRLIEIMRNAKPLLKRQQELYSAERGRRFGKAAGAMGGTEGRGRLYAGLSEMKGELPRVKFEPP